MTGTTPTGVPIILCLKCRLYHPDGRRHCDACGKPSLFINNAGHCHACRKKEGSDD